MPNYRAGKFLFGPDERYLPLTDTLIGMQGVVGGRGGEAYLITDEENLRKLQTMEHPSGGVSRAEFLKERGVKLITLHTLIDQTFPVGSKDWKAAKQAYQTLRDHPKKFPAAMQSDLAKTIFVQGPIDQDKASVNIGADLDVIFNPRLATLPENPHDLLSEGYAIAGSAHIAFSKVTPLSSEDRKKLSANPELKAMWERHKEFLKSGKTEFAIMTENLNEEMGEVMGSGRDPLPAGAKMTQSSEYLAVRPGSLPLGKSVADLNEFLVSNLHGKVPDRKFLVSRALEKLHLNFQKLQPSLTGHPMIIDERGRNRDFDPANAYVKAEDLGVAGGFSTQTWHGEHGDSGAFLPSKRIDGVRDLQHHSSVVLREFEEYLGYEGASESHVFQAIMDYSGMNVAGAAMPLPPQEERRKETFAERAAIMAAAGLTGLSQSAAALALGGGADRPQLEGGAGAGVTEDDSYGALTIAAAAAAGAAVLAGGAYLAKRYLGDGGAEPPPAPQPGRAGAAPVVAKGKRKR